MHAHLIPAFSLERVAQTRTVSDGEPIRQLAARLRTPLFEPGGVLAALRPEAQNELKHQAQTLAEVFRKIIIEHGTQYDLRSFVPALVRTAARGLQQTGEPSDIDLLSILLYSNNPGVSLAAVDAMIQIDPGATVAKAEQAVERGWIDGDTRRALVRFLSRAQAPAKPAGVGKTPGKIVQ